MQPEACPKRAWRHSLTPWTSTTLVRPRWVFVSAHVGFSSCSSCFFRIMEKLRMTCLWTAWGSNFDVHQEICHLDLLFSLAGIPGNTHHKDGRRNLR